MGCADNVEFFVLRAIFQFFKCWIC